MTLPHPLRAWRAARARRAEAESVPDSEVAGWGLTRDEFRDVALMPPERQARMEAMAAIHGVPEGRLAAAPAIRVQAALACARCREGRLCRSMMEDGAEAAEMTFCPNHEAYGALAEGA